MPVVTSPDLIQEQLENAFAQIEGSPLILHSDLVRIGYAPKGRSIGEQLADWLGMVQHAAAGRALLFPTFNYDFARTGRYRVESDPGQVGALNEYVRQQFPARRTHTPIFNFVVLSDTDLALGPSANPFDDASVFGRVRRAGGSVIFLGAGPDANTFIHHVEEAARIPYRYLKPFPGVIETGGTQEAFTLYYRVRPAIPGAVEYDWQRLGDELRSLGLLHSLPLGNARIEFYRAQALYDYWTHRLGEDEHFLLTDASRGRVEALYALHGKPLRLEAVEGRSQPPS